MKIQLTADWLPPTAPECLGSIYLLEKQERQREQVTPEMHHQLHAGVYARTCRLPEGLLVVSVMIKIPTTLIINGGCMVFAGDRWHRVEDYQVVAAAAGRKQVYATFGPTEITMLFRTDARTVEEAEEEFTDEADNLLSRRA